MIWDGSRNISNRLRAEMSIDFINVVEKVRLIRAEELNSPKSVELRKTPTANAAAISFLQLLVYVFASYFDQSNKLARLNLYSAEQNAKKFLNLTEIDATCIYVKMLIERKIYILKLGIMQCIGLFDAQNRAGKKLCRFNQLSSDAGSSTECSNIATFLSSDGKWNREKCGEHFGIDSQVS